MLSTGEESGVALVVHDEAACPECGAERVSRYRCTECPERFEIRGTVRFFPQSGSHWCMPNDHGAWIDTVSEHLGLHPMGGLLPDEPS